jgi:ribosomal protein S18 acetylase RimI-like enzyme
MTAMDRGEITIRPIVPADAATIADLHTASWRSAYRGMLRDDYLDGDIASERRQAWAARLGQPVDANYGFIAESEAGPAGFVFMLGQDDPTWGTLVDNLHVLPGLKGLGIGRRLLGAAALETQRRYPGQRVHLFVYEANVAARRFYAGVGGREVERGPVDPPGGGSQIHWRVAWDDAAQLLAAVRPAPRSIHGAT